MVGLLMHSMVGVLVVWLRTVLQKHLSEKAGVQMRCCRDVYDGKHSILINVAGELNFKMDAQSLSVGNTCPEIHHNLH